jgi:hypothetical protein
LVSLPIVPGTDCADTVGSRHPGAPEICGDGIDQDCSGADAPCSVVKPTRGKERLRKPKPARPR